MNNHLMREWSFMLRQSYVLVLLLCAFLVSSFSVLTGMSDIDSQRETIERLKTADQLDRAEAQDKHNSPGALAYYSFHLTYSEPSNLAFAALGERDIYPWKHRVRMLALEGQIYESDAQNPELAQAGKIDFAFVISALSPLLLILLFHDLFASERASGRHELLVTTTESSFALWGARVVVRLFAILVSLILPFYMGALINNVAMTDVLILSLWCLLYFIFWIALSLFIGRRESSAPRIASILIGFWALFTFVIPILGDLAINQSIHSPQGGEILLTQREAVNDAWDLPVQTTMNAFAATHPKYKGYKHEKDGFDWGWYYAFQQVGDQVAEPLSIKYREVALKKHQRASFVTLLSPTLLIQKKMTRLAETDALAAIEYERRIREYHRALRMTYYPWLFSAEKFDKSHLDLLPQFDSTTSGIANSRKNE